MDLLDGAICVMSDVMYVTGISPGLLYKGSHLLNKGAWSCSLDSILGPGLVRWTVYNYTLVVRLIMQGWMPAITTNIQW